MEDDKTTIRIDARAFARDFVRGASDDELVEKYKINLAQLPGLIELLQEKGLLTPEQVSQRGRRTGATSAGPLTARAERRSTTSSAPTGSPAPERRPPFEIIRGRTILLYIMIAFASTALYITILFAVRHGNMEHLDARTSVILGLVFYAFLLLLLHSLLSRAKLSPTALVGPLPPWSVFSRHLILVFPLFMVGMTLDYLLYFHLSHMRPEYVKDTILDSSMLFCSRDSVLTNVLSFFLVVVIVPALDEFVFRGLLLTRWSLKWNVPKAVLVSSLVCALLRINPVAGFFLGYVMCVVYIETKSLLVPIAIRMAVGTIMWSIAATAVYVYGSKPNAIIPVWQSYWWIALLGGIVVVPWAVLFVRRHFPSKDWRAPYFALNEAVDQTDGLAKTA